jgi:electron transport complex protein RnfG
MSAATTLEAPPAPRAAPMYRSMVGIGVVCGLLIVIAFQWTSPIIQRNKAEALQRAIFRVLPAARASQAFRLTPEGRFEKLQGVPGGGEVVYAGYDEQGALVGLAIEGRGMGYQDVIRLIYGYSPAEDAIVGMYVLESKETPGLGDKIIADPDFAQNFEKLDVSLTDDAQIAHAIVAVKHGEKKQPWEIDGITGATVSSKAVASLLAGSTSYWIPRIKKSLDEFRRGE